MAMAALALLVVHRSFSRVRHALLWSAGCAMGALQWVLRAVTTSALGPDTALHIEIGASLCGLISVLLLVEGFRVRAVPRPPLPPLLLIGGAAAISLAVALIVPAIPLRPAIGPFAGALLIGWAVTMVRPADGRRGPTEIMATVALLAMALVYVVRIALALGAAAGLLAFSTGDDLIYLLAVAPARAALSLAVLLLIAHDFSAELRRLGHTDPLTGVLNRHGLNHAAAPLLRHARAAPLCVAIADIDLFKQVNDRHGHAAGDATLRCFAAHLAAGLARDDAVARIGGEEFALLLPATDGARAVERIERTRATLTSLRVADHPMVAVAASFGIAERHPGETLEQVLERADHALYRSKREGRDRTTFATRPGSSR